MLTIDETHKSKTEIEDRKGWVTDTYGIRNSSAKLGYVRCETNDGGYANEYIKGFQSTGLLAVIQFSGDCSPDENVPAVMISLSFENCVSGRRLGGKIKLSNVPPVLLSE